ncbi:ShlB/FhaC/HecB family hemolysin secretion/activation protein [Serratia sp. L9]|uniref:ShlB/FhaC/HecB family hemolysin secretion/activation protein n=1 Tax=Serratia sp. L9 TaxID=3423946 RepID=UPI003D67123D
MGFCEYWLLGATVSNSDYHQTVAGINQSYVYSGKSKTAAVQLTRLQMEGTAI